MSEAVRFAASCIVDDRDPMNEREEADGHQYVTRILNALAETSLVPVDFDRPEFMTMRESVRHLGAAGPDIDYDVAPLIGGVPYRITGTRGGASYVGIVIYGAGGTEGASAILDSVDVDDLAGPDGTFVYDIDHPDASRVIIRQYFHDRAREALGEWRIERTDQPTPPSGPAPTPHPAMVGHRIANAANTLRWNASLNQLWTPERRDHPNEFIALAADEIVAAIPNPDVAYSFTWWRLGEGEALEIEVTPPATRYWAVQLCDRWFQSYPQRRTNLNDQQVVAAPGGTVRIVLADGDPGVANWLDTGGHHTGVVFFRWLHAEPDSLPTCRVVRR